MTTCSSTSGRPSPAPGNAFEVKASPPVQIRGRASGAASSRTCFLRMPVIVSRSWSPAGRNPRSRTSSQVGRSAVWSPRGTGRKRSAPAIPSRNRQLDRIPRRVGTVGTVAALVPGRSPGHDPAGHIPSVGDSVEVDEDLLLVSGDRLGGDERGRKFYLQQPALVRAVFDPGAQGRNGRFSLKSCIPLTGRRGDLSGPLSRRPDRRSFRQSTAPRWPPTSART